MTTDNLVVAGAPTEPGDVVPDVTGLGRAPGGSIFDDGIPTPGEMQVIDWLLNTTRSNRKTLDLTRPVEPEVIERCLRTAQQAPTAHNSQHWHWVVVTDADKRAAIAEVYRNVWLQSTKGERRQGRRWKAASQDNKDYDRVQDSAAWLPDHLHEVPVFVIPCLVGPRYDNEMLVSEWMKQMEIDPVTGERGQKPSRLWLDAGFFASIYPAVWQFQLALRAYGLGTVLTVNHLAHEHLVKDVLSLPNGVVQTCLLPVAYTTKRTFGPAKRQPLESKISWNSWKGTR